MKKRILALFLVTVLTFSLSACNQTENVPSEVTVSETSTVTEIETIPVPEGGWTREELTKTIRINGEPLPEPFTVNSLGDDFELDTELYSYDETENLLSANLLYKGEFVCVISIEELEECDFEAAKKSEKISIIWNIKFDDNPNMKTTNVISVNGISLDSSSEKIISTFGEPDLQPVTSTLVYHNRDTGDEILAFWTNTETNEISNIIIRFEPIGDHYIIENKEEN